MQDQRSPWNYIFLLLVGGVTLSACWVAWANRQDCLQWFLDHDASKGEYLYYWSTETECVASLAQWSYQTERFNLSFSRVHMVHDKQADISVYRAYLADTRLPDAWHEALNQWLTPEYRARAGLQLTTAYPRGTYAGPSQLPILQVAWTTRTRDGERHEPSDSDLGDLGFYNSSFQETVARAFVFLGGETGAPLSGVTILATTACNPSVPPDDPNQTTMQSFHDWSSEAARTCAMRATMYVWHLEEQPQQPMEPPRLYVTEAVLLSPGSTAAALIAETDIEVPYVALSPEPQWRPSAAAAPPPKMLYCPKQLYGEYTPPEALLACKLAESPADLGMLGLGDRRVPCHPEPMLAKTFRCNTRPLRPEDPEYRVPDPRRIPTKLHNMINSMCPRWSCGYV